MVVNHVIVCLLCFVYNMSNMLLYCMSCIICLNNFFFLFVCRPESPVVLTMDCGIPKTDILSDEPITHCNKDHHSYVMVVHRDKLYRSDQRGAPGVTSWEVRRPSLWGPLTYLLPML